MVFGPLPSSSLPLPTVVTVGQSGYVSVSVSGAADVLGSDLWLAALLSFLFSLILRRKGKNKA